MRFKRILITGGAGFVGTHLARELIKQGDRVRVLDNLDPQVHEKSKGRPALLPKKVEFMRGDVSQVRDVEKAVKGVDAIYHLAAAVGVGQSMYQIRHYVNANSMGGATVLESIVRHKATIKKVVVASSMSIYGEGAYFCQDAGPVFPSLRPLAQLKKKQWEMRWKENSQIAEPRPTPETKPLNPTSIYAVTKRDHEENFLAVGQAYRVPTVALRFFNIYGPFQALSNPYTGVAAIFSSRLLKHEAPLIFEDGGQTRDFIHVSDIVQACVLAMKNPKANFEVFNVGTGRPTSVLEMAKLLTTQLGLTIKPKILRRFRAGDIRHCYADISKIKRTLSYKPRIQLEDGIKDLIMWVRIQKNQDRVNQAVKELNKFGLVV